MCSVTQTPAAPDRPRPARQRGWHEFSDYKHVHNRQMSQLVEAGFVAEDNLSFGEVREGGHLVGARLTGRIRTGSGSILTVKKEFETRGRAGRDEVRTKEYSYHAHTLVPRTCDLFRYDNCHGGLETLHRHEFDANGDEAGQDDIAHEEMPWLSEVIEEAQSAGAKHGIEPQRRRGSDADETETNGDP